MSCNTRRFLFKIKTGELSSWLVIIIIITWGLLTGGFDIFPSTTPSPGKLKFYVQKILKIYKWKNALVKKFLRSSDNVRSAYKKLCLVEMNNLCLFLCI